jgi:hypothetical protein
MALEISLAPWEMDMIFVVRIDIQSVGIERTIAEQT